MLSGLFFLKPFQGEQEEERQQEEEEDEVAKKKPFHRESFFLEGIQLSIEDVIIRLDGISFTINLSAFKWEIEIDGVRKEK